LKGKSKARTISYTRLLDCMHYSRCLMQAAQTCSSSKHFSCAMCESYKQEKLSDEDKILETIRALKLFDAVWKDCETEKVPSLFADVSIPAFEALQDVGI
jgi:hypothetical protein